MNGLDPQQQQSVPTNSSCLLASDNPPFEPQAEDILTDEDLLDLFRIVKQVLRKNPDSERLGKLLFCMSYALGDHIKFSKPCHDDRIIFRDIHSAVHSVRLPSTSSCCTNLNHRSSTSQNDLLKPEKESVQKWVDSTSVTSINSPSPISPLTRLPSVSYLTNSSPINTSMHPLSSTPLSDISNENTSTDPYAVRPYTNFRPLFSTTSSTSQTANHTSINSITSPIVNGNPNSIPSPSSQSTTTHHQQHNQVLDIADLTLNYSDSTDQASPRFGIQPNNGEIVMEPQQRGFYYQDGRIAREPVLLQRYAEQGILTQASLMRKRKRHSMDGSSSYETSSNSPVSTKKPKIPHRHGEFESRRDDIINRMRSITMADLEQKAQRLPHQFTLAIDKSVTTNEEMLAVTVANRNLTQDQLAELLEPALRILTNHSNMKPHLDNGMNQNGIYYNSDYFRLYLAFEQFQRTFAILFPNEIVKSDPNEESLERDKDRERNANMKAYRSWIEPLLTETNWAAFRRNIVVGERMMQLTKSVGQGVLLMTKELSGSKLHLTFTNSEWDEFIYGLNSGRWDETIDWEAGQKKQLEQQRKGSASLLIAELRIKFKTNYWFHPDGLLVSSKERRLLIHASTVSNNNSNSSLVNLHRNSLESNLLQQQHSNHHR